MKEIIIYLILGIVISTVIYMGWSKVEKADCLRLADQSQNYPNWYATQSEHDNCKIYNINLEPVKKLSRM